MGIGIGSSVSSSEIRCRGIYDLISGCRFIVYVVLIGFLVVGYKVCYLEILGMYDYSKELLKAIVGVLFLVLTVLTYG